MVKASRCVFLLTLAYSVLVSASEYISCHNCVSISPYQTCKALSRLKDLHLFFGPRLSDLPVDFCIGFGPKDPYFSVGMVKQKYSCVRLDFEVDFKNETKQKVTWRTIMEKGRCPHIEKEFHAAVDAYAGHDVDGKIVCYECGELLCNLGSTVQISLLMLVMSVISISVVNAVMRS